MVHHENIKVFVQKTLGCGCPEEVFQHIDCRSCIQLQDCTIRNRINIGNRLLIYVIEMSNTDSLANILTVLIHAGKKERDSSGFNRLRLVLATDYLHEMTQVAEALFQDMNKDEKIHLHIVHKDSIPDF
jgi:hypothetical protein